MLFEGRLSGQQIDDYVVATCRGKRVDVSGDSHAVEGFFLSDVRLCVGYGFAQVRKLLSGDVLFFVNLPNLIFALVGDAGIFRFLDLDAEFFQFRPKASWRLGW